MLTKRNFLSLILIISMLLLIIGCEYRKTNLKASSHESVTKIELTISAASSLIEVMEELSRIYTTKNSNIQLTFNFGSSGSLKEQIEQGAPCDLFISAGKNQMTDLLNGNFLIDETNKDLVKNSLVLIGPKDTSITNIDDLLEDKVKTIAIGEISSVPAGKYADEAITNLGIKESIKDKLVFAKDVKSVLTWTSTGNSDTGFVYLSDTTNMNNIKIIATISSDLHSPITYPISVMRNSKNIEAAKAFEEFLLSRDAQSIFQKYGYESLY